MFLQLPQAGEIKLEAIERGLNVQLSAGRQFTAAADKQKSKATDSSEPRGDSQMLAKN